MRALFIRAIESARESIHIHTFTLSDKKILKALDRAEKRGVHLDVVSDPKSPEHPYAVQKVAGLLHEKYLIVDRKLVLFGSANLTKESFRDQDNLVAVFMSEQCAESLLEEQPAFKISMQEEGLTVWRLPHKAPLVNTVADLLLRTQRRIRLSLFQLTHPLLIEALVQAFERGVALDLTLDRSSAKTFYHLRKQNIPCCLSPGGRMIHNKQSRLDGTMLLFGSANWSKSAFEKNKEILALHAQY